MAKRKMKWRKEKSFEGFACNQCGWLFPNPRLIKLEGKEELLAEARSAFESHDCEEYPSVTKRMQRN